MTSLIVNELYIGTAEKKINLWEILLLLHSNADADIIQSQYYICKSMNLVLHQSRYFRPVSINSLSAELTAYQIRFLFTHLSQTCQEDIVIIYLCILYYYVIHDSNILHLSVLQTSQPWGLDELHISYESILFHHVSGRQQRKC